MAENQYYMSVAWLDDKQKYLAVISEGHPKKGDENIKVCTLELFDNKKDAKPWFAKQLEEKPWLPRN